MTPVGLLDALSWGFLPVPLLDSECSSAKAEVCLGLLCLQSIQTRQQQDLIVVASDLKACTRRGLTLVAVYGGFSTAFKVATLMHRKTVNAKFDKVGAGPGGRGRGLPLHSCSIQHSSTCGSCHNSVATFCSERVGGVLEWGWSSLEGRR